MAPFSPKFIYLLYLLSVVTTHALNVPFERRASRGVSISSPFRATRYSFGQAGSDQQSLGDVGDLRYVTNITINGVEVQVALDTGSTDLWVIPPGGLGTFNDTGIPLELSYGDGSYGTGGSIGVSPFTFGPYNVERQAFMSATTSTIGGLQENGIYGLMGLSFDFSSASPINQKIKSIYGPDATWGRSVLRNIFAQDPTEPNFIGLDLARTGDLEDTTGGSFTIGEYDDRFTVVSNEIKLPQYPKGGDRWTTLLEGIFVDGAAIPLQSTISGVPNGQVQALLDTGDPTSIYPIALLDAIYSHIPGSALYNDPSQQTHAWIVPCNTTANVQLAFASGNYPIHPLDLSTISQPFVIDGKDYIACVSSFTGADNWAPGAFDVSLGDTFLRNVYSVFDFGDTLPDGSVGEPYIQLLSKTDPTTAIAQVTTIRGQTMATLPPEIAPADLVAALLRASVSSGTSTALSTPTGYQVDPTSDASSRKSLVATNGDGLVSIDDSIIKRYGLIIVCLLAGNLLFTSVLIIFAILNCVRRGTSRKSSWASPPTYVPVKNALDHHDEEFVGGYQRPYSQ